MRKEIFKKPFSFLKTITRLYQNISLRLITGFEVCIYYDSEKQANSVLEMADFQYLTRGSAFAQKMKDSIMSGNSKNL